MTNLQQVDKVLHQLCDISSCVVLVKLWLLLDIGYYVFLLHEGLFLMLEEELHNIITSSPKGITKPGR